MLHYSFSTVVMAVIASNLIIALTAICFCSKDLLVSFGYKMLALVLGAAFLRCVLPFEFPFTSNIIMPQAFSRVVAGIWHTRFTAGPVQVSIWTAFEAVWAIGVLARLAVIIRDQLAFNHQVVWHSINMADKGHYARLLDEACGDGPNPFGIYALAGLKVPMLYGIRTPRILVPLGMDLPEEDLRCLLSHETAHHFHHDILIKLGVNLLSAVYWWNPACYALKGQMDAILEMRIDHYVTGGAWDSKQKYLKCLINVAEQSAGQEAEELRLPVSSIPLLNSRSFDNLTNRFLVMGGDPKPYAKALHACTLALTAAVFLFSYAFIFEARYAAPEEGVSTVEASDPYFYVIMTEAGTYEVYYGDHLVETVDSLDNFPDRTPVYNSLDEVPPEMRISILKESGMNK